MAEQILTGIKILAVVSCGLVLLWYLAWGFCIGTAYFVLEQAKPIMPPQEYQALKQEFNEAVANFVRAETGIDLFIK